MNLRTLSRNELQILAKREGIKGNLKTENIIQQLLQKHPEGYPRTLEPPESKNSAKGPEVAIGGTTQGTITQPLDPNFQGPPCCLATAHHPNESHNIPRDIYSPVPARGNEELQCLVEFRMPTKKDLRFVRRELTQLVNEKNKLHDELEESDQVLQRALDEMSSIAYRAEQLTWMRIGIETFINREMKDDRTVWDGTVFMSKQSQKKWKRYLEEDKRRRENALPGIYVPSLSDNDPAFALLHFASRNTEREEENENEGE